MGMDHRISVRHRHMDRTVNGEASRVHHIVGRHDDVAIEVDLHKARCGDLVKAHTIRIDEKVMFRPRHTRRDMRIDEVAPAIMSNETVGRREIDAHLPLCFRYLFAHRNVVEILRDRHGAHLPDYSLKPDSYSRQSATGKVSAANQRTKSRFKHKLPSWPGLSGSSTSLRRS